MNNHKETVLVTGATGTVGSEVVKHLAALTPSADYNVKAAIHSKNKSDQLRQFENKGVEIVDLDFTKQETIAHALNNVDKVFIQTLPVPNVADISSNLINEPKKNDVKCIVKLSAMGAGSEPEFLFAVARRRRKNNRRFWNTLYLFTTSSIYAKFCNSTWPYNKNSKCILYSCRRRKDEFYRC
jgi:nucleoside-diphosphate-sugar epimerase